MINSTIRKEVISILKECNLELTEGNIQVVIEYKLANGGFEPESEPEQPAFDCILKIYKILTVFKIKFDLSY